MILQAGCEMRLCAVAILIVLTACAGYALLDEEVMVPDELSFYAEVLEFDPDYFLRNADAMLFVYSVTSVGGHPVGGRYFIQRNDSVVVLDGYGAVISYEDILPGSLVEIVFRGVVMESDPGVVSGVVRITVEPSVTCRYNALCTELSPFSRHFPKQNSPNTLSKTSSPTSSPITSPSPT